MNCDWFNIFYPSLQIIKYACDNSKDYRQSNVDELLKHCKLQKNVDFDIHDTASSTETTDQNGRISYYFTIDQDSEQISIAEHVPSGYPYVRVFCSTTERGDYPKQWEEEQTPGDGTYSYQHDKYAQVACASSISLNTTGHLRHDHDLQTLVRVQLPRLELLPGLHRQL